MADIRINELPEDSNPNANDAVPIDGASTRKTTLKKLVDAGAPVASRAEAEAGTNAEKRMTPLTVHQAIDSRIGTEPGMIASANDSRLVTVFNYIKTAVKASQFCKGNGTNEDAAFAAFFAALEDNGVDGVVDIPVRLASSKTLTGYMATLRAAGEGRLTFTGGTDGIIVDNSGIASGPISTFGWDNLRLDTETDGLGVAFRFTGSSYISDSLVRSFYLDRPQFYGVNPSFGWSKGGVIQKSAGSVINAPYVMGRASLSGGCMVSGFEFFNSCNTIDIVNPFVAWSENGILVRDAGGFSEAIRLQSGAMLAAKAGFVTQAPGQYHSAKGVHFDTTRVGIQFGVDYVDGSYFSTIEDCFFLRSAAEGAWSSAPGVPNIYVAAGINANFVAIRGCRIHISGEVDANGVSRQAGAQGIVIGSLVDSNKIGIAAIAGNVISGPTIPVHLRVHTVACNAQGNTIDSYGNTGMTPTGILNDGGAQNFTKDNVVRNAAGVVSFT